MSERGGSARVTEDAQAVGRARATSTPDLKDAEVRRVTDAQRIRLYHQAMATKDMLEQERDRDLLQLGHQKDALRAMNDSTSNQSRGAQKVVKE